MIGRKTLLPFIVNSFLIAIDLYQTKKMLRLK